MTDLVTPLATRTLVPHPQAPCSAVSEVAVEIGVEAGDVLAVTWRIAGDLPRLRIPAIGERLDPDRLWAHTCGELFVASADREDYVEWNFSPSGQIARFEFSAYRQRRPRADVGAAAGPSVARSSVAIEGLRLHARAPLPPDLGGEARISITAVVEDALGAHSYWALHHPADRPDFHHRGGFALALTLQPSPAIVDALESS